MEIENMLRRRDEQSAAQVMAEREAHQEMLNTLKKQVEDVRVFKHHLKHNADYEPTL